jgi:hypothetical protein
VDQAWLRPREVNVGYALFPAARGKGYASRAVELLLMHLRRDTEHTVATLLIDSETSDRLRSLAASDSRRRARPMASCSLPGTCPEVVRAAIRTGVIPEHWPNWRTRGL